MSAFITRFAPSPTGHLHLGHASSALHVWRAADEAGGHVLLRIEDIDTTRCRPELTQAIFEDLHWLGLDWPEPVRVQSNHFDDYAKVVSDLAARGLAYRCFRTRTEIAAETEALNIPAFRGSKLPPDQEADRLDRGDLFAWRLSLTAARDRLGPAYDQLTYTTQSAEGVVTHRANPYLHGDIVIARKDSPSAYHLAATHDDALQEITHIIRGEDLIDAPHTQTLLQALMGWSPVIYRNHPLVLGADGRKLSKRQGSISLADLRADGMTAEQIRNQLGFS
ncbi:MAG: tRNA glutamyl-Q(34) synthetase GluQRS [Henriciella sp.]